MLKSITPIVVAVFAVYLTIGITLGILPGFIRHDLHFGNTVVGLVIGLQSLSTLLTRAWSGKVTDTKGAHISKGIGIALVAASGVAYLLASVTSGRPTLCLSLILLSRVLHGAAESLVVTGILTWGIGLAGQQHAGKVMTWNGIAMYAGIAAGAPLGMGVTAACGLATTFLAVIILSAAGWIATTGLPTIPADRSHRRTPFYKVVSLVAGQGLGLAFSSVGFACIASFISLLFAQRTWPDASLAFVSFGAAYVLARVFFASLPDRYGGQRVALISLVIEVAGQLLIAIANSGAMATAGCALTGAGFSLIFPSLGTLAIKKTPTQMRGTALGAYAAFFDLSLGLAGPLAGLIANIYGYPAIYFFGAALSALAALILVTANVREQSNDIRETSLKTRSHLRSSK